MAEVKHRLHTNDFKEGASGFGLRIWVARPAHGVPAEAVFDPGFWVNAVQRNDVKPGDRIEVLAQDGSYDLDLRALEIGPTPNSPLWVRVRVLRSWPDAALEGMTAAPAARPSLSTSVEEMVVEFAGPSHKWRVVRKSDRAVLAHGFASKEDAQAAMKKAA